MAQGDTRQLVTFPGPMFRRTIANMRDHLLTLQQIDEALSKKDFDKALPSRRRAFGHELARTPRCRTYGTLHAAGDAGHRNGDAPRRQPLRDRSAKRQRQQRRAAGAGCAEPGDAGARRLPRRLSPALSGVKGTTGNAACCHAWRPALWERPPTPLRFAPRYQKRRCVFQHEDVTQALCQSQPRWKISPVRQLRARDTSPRNGLYFCED